MGAKNNKRGQAAGRSTSVEEDGGGHVEEDSKPSLVTSGEPIGSGPGQDAVQEEASPDQILSKIPSGWTRVKLEPDC